VVPVYLGHDRDTGCALDQQHRRQLLPQHVQAMSAEEFS
jgi:hypothetical protein